MYRVNKFSVRPREISKDNGFVRIIDERKNLSFFKIFDSADLYSETMRKLPYNIMKRISSKDFSYKMVIKAQWGSSWEVKISKNPGFYYMEKQGWNQFVSDNDLGNYDFITFTHVGKMCFNVNIFEQNGREMTRPRKLPTLAPPREIKKEKGEKSYKDVKKEDDIEEVEVIIKKKKVEETKISKKKKKIETKKVNNGVPEFSITISKSYLKFLGIPKRFVEKHIPHESKIYTIHHPNGKGSWKVLCLMRESRAVFSKGWTKLARMYPLSVGDRCIFKLIKPTDFLLVISNQAA